MNKDQEAKLKYEQQIAEKAIRAFAQKLESLEEVIEDAYEQSSDSYVKTTRLDTIVEDFLKEYFGMEKAPAERIKFTLNGCDISFIATAPADMTVAQLVKQGSRIIPDWCACGICDADNELEPEIEFDYDDVDTTSGNVSCRIEGKPRKPEDD